MDEEAVEAALLAALLALGVVLWRRLRRPVTDLADDIAINPRTPAGQRPAYQALAGTFAPAWSSFVDGAVPILVATQQAGLTLGGRAASAATGTPATASPDVALGVAADGRPLRQVLLGVGQEVAADIALLARSGAAVSAGDLLTTVQARIQTGVTRATGLLRQEFVRAGRAARLAVYRATPGVSKWVWISRRDRNTCAVCYALHGSVHDLSERFSSHRNCRCVPTPLRRGEQPPTSGVDLFAALPESEQRQILGPGKLALYQSGALPLSALVGQGVDARGVPYRYERPLKDLVTQ